VVSSGERQKYHTTQQKAQKPKDDCKSPGQIRVSPSRENNEANKKRGRPNKTSTTIKRFAK